MIEDISRYSPERKKASQQWYKDNSERYGSMTIGLIAHMTGCACIIVVCWIAEIDGWTPELLRIFKIIRDYYNYTEIRNLPESAPLDLFS